jgi:hypothetical protein
MMLRSSCLLFAAGLVALSGCGPAKLDVTKTYTMDGTPQLVILDAQPKPQKITVEFESTGAEVTVLLIKKSDCPEGEEAFVPTAKAIASKKDKSGTITGEVPEKTETLVIVRGGTKTDVKLHITNK